MHAAGYQLVRQSSSAETPTTVGVVCQERRVSFCDVVAPPPASPPTLSEPAAAATNRCVHPFFFHFVFVCSLVYTQFYWVLLSFTGF